jgi:hypothetical protein
MEIKMESGLEPSKSEDKHGEVTFHIAVNGVAEDWHKKKITYAEVVHLAFPHGPVGPNIRYSITWTMPHGEEGSMRPGDFVTVENGMLFHVRNTDKS